VTNNAGSFNRNGEKAPLHQYASSAATGSATSSSDLAKFVLALIPESGSDIILSPQTQKIMREPHGQQFGFDIWGLGTILYAPSSNGDFVFGHDGGNDPAINSAARINPATGDAIISLETGHLSLATNIGSAWVLWQTGYPDVLGNDAVMASMTVPASLGVLFILLIILVRRYSFYRVGHVSSKTDQ
jgi:hypothetical protein